MSDHESQKCTRCGQVKPIADYYETTRHKRKMRYKVCKVCYAISRIDKRRSRTQANKDTRGINFLFQRRCGGCGKKISRVSRQRGNLCNTCSRQGRDSAMYIDMYMPLMGISSAISSCPGCAFVQVCQVRVNLGLWTVCEMPDKADVDRATIAGIETDGRKIILHREQIKDPLLWPAWWPETVDVGEGGQYTVERVNHESLR